MIKDSYRCKKVIIPTVETSDIPTWQKELRQCVTNPTELMQLLELDPAVWTKKASQQRALQQIVSQQFPLKVPRPFITRMTKGNPEDPLLKQVLPVLSETITNSGYSRDPLAEQNRHQPAGMIKKYHGRVLLIVSGHCAINCRYCFRRHFPYREHRLNRQQWLNIIADIAADSTISEVILSGGDPLAVSDNQLTWLTQEIAAIPHIKRLRVHTRLPVVIPSRIDASCIAWMKNTRLQTVVVLHINHANEIDCQLTTAVAELRQAGVTLLNQTVLLKGINDHADDLTELSERLFSVGIMPYYLHLLDKVDGAKHFDTSEADAKKIYRQLLSQLPGYLAPKLVREVPDMAYKLPLI